MASRRSSTTMPGVPISKASGIESRHPTETGSPSLSYMVATLREVSPGFGRSTEALLRHVAAMGSSREVVLAQFLADLSAIGETRIDVILDDYHLVEESLDIRMIMSRLLERAPEGMRFILAGRGRPNLALGRLLAQGRVVELTIDDLRFTKSEIAELFAATYQQPLDDGRVHRRCSADRGLGCEPAARLRIDRRKPTE